MELLLNRILPCSFIDGPGSRMVLFLQGCNMSCRYCHNPETQQPCCHCGSCVDACPTGALTRSGSIVRYRREKCRQCDACLAACPHFSSPKSQLLPLDELLPQIVRAAPFLSGITVSGGECSLQTPTLCELFRRVHAQTALSAFVDTNGLIATADMTALLEAADGFCFDLKAWNRQLHQQLTGVSNDSVKENLSRTASVGKLYEVRTVLVENYTDSAEEISAMASWLHSLPGNFNWKLIPFRPHGVRGDFAKLPPFPAARYQELLRLARTILGPRIHEIRI